MDATVAAFFGNSRQISLARVFDTLPGCHYDATRSAVAPMVAARSAKEESHLNFDLRHYTIRRKLLKIFGASFHVYDDSGNVVGFSSQKAFKLREDIRVYADESKAKELMVIRARQVIDFAAAYDIVDSTTNRKVGAARRKGWSSLIKDSWELLDDAEHVLATFQEDSVLMAIL